MLQNELSQKKKIASLQTVQMHRLTWALQFMFAKTLFLPDVSHMEFTHI